MEKKVRSAFVFGMAFACSLVSLHQDMMGQEAYAKLVETNWVSGWITVPLAIVCAVASLYEYGKIKASVKDLECPKKKKDNS